MCERGAALAQARRRKELRYPELAEQHIRAKLVVLASEVGGRWSEEWPVLVPAVGGGPQLRGANGAAFPSKTSLASQVGSLFYCSSARAFAMSLLERRGGTGAGCPLPPQPTWCGRPVLAFPRVVFSTWTDTLSFSSFREEKTRRTTGSNGASVPQVVRSFLLVLSACISTRLTR